MVRSQRWGGSIHHYSQHQISTMETSLPGGLVPRKTKGSLSIFSSLRCHIPHFSLRAYDRESYREEAGRLTLVHKSLSIS